MLHSGRWASGGVDNDADGLGRGVSVAKEGSYISLEIASRLNGTMPHDLKPFIMFFLFTPDSQAFLKRLGKVCLFTA